MKGGEKMNEKAYADFRKLSASDKHKECTRYGNTISSFDVYTTDGWLTIRITEIYGAKFIFIILTGEVINCYELQ